MKVLVMFCGSTSLAMLGVDVEVNDVDILTNKYGAEQLDLLLSKYRIKKLEHSEIGRIRSYFGIYSINGIKVEIMGDLQHKLEMINGQKLII